MRKKSRNQRKKTFTKQKPIAALSENSARLVTHKIIDGPIIDEQYEKLPNFTKRRLSELEYLVFSEPRESISALLDLSEKYPHIPKIKNFLNIAYINIGEKDKAREMTLEIYEKFPDYFLGKTNYALFCLQVGDPEKIPEIFGNNFDLQLLYPNRKEFYATEYASFSAVMSLYYIYLCEFEIAKIYCDLMNELDPDSQLTKMVKKRFSPLNRLRARVAKHLRKFINEKEKPT